MSVDPKPVLLSLEDLLPENFQKQLQQLSPGIGWALDGFAVSFGEEIEHLDQAAKEAFARLTLDYGQTLHHFLELARETLDAEKVLERARKKELIGNLDLFSGLNEFDLGQIASAFERVTFHPGEFMAVQGAEGEAVYYLEEGQVGIVVDGNQVAVRTRGSLFGEISCITGDPVTASLRADSECGTLRMSRQNFEQIVLTLPELLPKIARIGFNRLDEVTHRLSEVVSHMPDALLKVDRAGIITGDISSKCFQYLGEQVLTGKSFSAIMFKDHGKNKQQWEQSYQELWDHPEWFQDLDFPIPRECEFRLNNGDLRYYRINLLPCERRGQQDGFDVAISDLTEQKRIQKEREQMERALRRKKKQFMLLLLGGETFGLEIEKVQEIIEKPHITRMPNAPPYLRGFFNLRGRIIPALDLSVMLKIPRLEADADRKECVFVVEFTEGENVVSLGLVADAVDEILEVFENDISDLPEIGSTIGRMDFMYGVATVEQEVYMLLNVDGILSLDERRALERLAAGQGKSA